MAISYSGGDKGKQMPTVFKIGVGAINRGASLEFCSQYAGEVRDGSELPMLTLHTFFDFCCVLVPSIASQHNLLTLQPC